MITANERVAGCVCVETLGDVDAHICTPCLSSLLRGVDEMWVDAARLRSAATPLPAWELQIWALAEPMYESVLGSPNGREAWLESGK